MKTQKPKRRNPYVSAMLKRHPRKQVLPQSRGHKRAKDARKSWRSEQW